MSYILDLLLPDRCLNCNTIIKSQTIICENCYDKINFTHWEAFENNPLQLKLNSFFDVKDCYALMLFEKEGLSRKIIHQLKYGHREIIGKVIAKWVLERILLKQQPDYLVTIPVHQKKLKKRGYNQLHLFADTLADHWKIPHIDNYLERISSGSAQARNKRVKRQKEKNDFRISNKTENSHILLIDDVCTTGNTLAHCAREILKGTNNTVSILVMAFE